MPMGNVDAVRTVTVRSGEGAFILEARATVMPRGIVVAAFSPDFAHVGATAQAIPRPEEGRTATVSILAVPCHRDEIPARDIAAALATRFRVPAVASCGFHIENATPDDIRKLLSVTRELIDGLCDAVEGLRCVGEGSGECPYTEDFRPVGPKDQLTV